MLRNFATAFGYFILSVTTFGVASQAQEEIVFAQHGGVQLISKPVELGRDDYMATVVELRATSSEASLVTFTNISITGAVAQLHGAISSALSPSGNAFKESAGPLYREEFATIDTHLLLERSMIAGGVWGIHETNDKSYGRGGFSVWPFADRQPKSPYDIPVAGIGPLHFTNPTDAFFLLPEYQQSAMDFAYVVTPTGHPKPEVRMTLGLLGSGFINAGEEGGAAFGYDGNPDVVVPFVVPEPPVGMVWLLGGLAVLGRRFGTVADDVENWKTRGSGVFSNWCERLSDGMAQLVQA